MADYDTNRDKICMLNDEFRRTLIGGRVVTTASVAARPDLAQIMLRVRTFATFSDENDPHGERDFGGFDYEGDRFFWKIDYFDRQLKFGSEDPSDPTVTSRVLTVMLASEY